MREQRWTRQRRIGRGNALRVMHARYEARFLVLAAFFAATERPRVPFVRAAFFAAAERDAALRLDAARLPCADNARFEAALRPSRRKARDEASARLALERLAVARLRVADLPVLARLRLAPLLLADCLPDDFFRGSLTPARRAFESPIAIACCAERAPCLPLRTCSISSCTYSPA